jgi:microcystin-dependent protein
MEVFIGTVLMFAGNFAPRGWAFCNGQLMSIAQNTALFSILGTTYGGDGQTTFALPNLNGRVPVHPGNGIVLGEEGGSASVTLLVSEIPAHNHIVAAFNAGGNNGNPTDGFPAKSSEDIYNSTADATMATAMIQPTGGSQPHNNMQPYLGINFIIALEGIFPSRS